MKIQLVTNEKIAETSSKGNQEKWLDKDTNKWYKVDQFGYEALSEALISALLCKSKQKNNTSFHFVRYYPEKVIVHGRERVSCVSDSFLKEGQSIITLSHLLTKNLGVPLRDRLLALPSDKQRIAYLAEKTAEYTGLERFGEYLTILFEIDSLFLNDDRHLNNIAVIEQNGKYLYCPIFDNGAGLLSNVQMSPMDIEPKALISTLKARPFLTSFTRQMNTARALFGSQLSMPKFSKAEIMEELSPLLEFYPSRDRGIITDRVCSCILMRQKFNQI
ncbi:MAG: hypothetical protein J6D26_09400 [Clostridia bacterium]|nr:hypothetical protein [Clostridia bacterium]